MRVLLVEDDYAVSQSIETMLKKEGMIIDTTDLGEDGLEIGKLYDYDIIILDLMLPDINGYEVLKRLRSAKIETPVLILSGLTEPDKKVKGLGFGADDYLTKPFDAKELLARIRAMTRMHTQSPDSSLSFGNITLDRTTFELAGPNTTMKLPNKEFQMLELLLSNPKQVISTERMFEKIWGYDSDTESNVVWVYVSYLRKKLAAVGSDVKIKASRNAGYSLVIE